jgi:hypothetical protein
MDFALRDMWDGGRNWCLYIRVVSGDFAGKTLLVEKEVGAAL